MKKSYALALLVSLANAPGLTQGLLVPSRRAPPRPTPGGGAPHPRFTVPASKGFHGEMRQWMTPDDSATVGETVKQFAVTLWASPGRALSFAKDLFQVLHWQGLSFFFLMGWFFEPAMEVPYNFFRERFIKSKQKGSSIVKKPYSKSFFRQVVDHIAQASKIAFSVYVVDTLRIALQALGVTSIPHLAKIPHAYMRVAYTFWIVDRIAAFKRHFVARKTQSNPNRLPNKVQFVNRAIDVVLYSTGILTAVAAVKADLGAAAKGFVALGSFSTLLVSLATQNVASQVVSGLFLDLSNRIHKGESIRIGNAEGASKVERMGWLHTEMRGPDDVKVVVPNKVLVDKEVSKLTGSTSQVKQKLQFKYQDVNKLPALMESIKHEIVESCPEVITDGTRPFRAHFENFGNKLEVSVEVHFRIEPTTNEYWDSRQEVLLAITRAVDKTNLEFAQA